MSYIHNIGHVPARDREDNKTPRVKAGSGDVFLDWHTTQVGRVIAGNNLMPCQTQPAIPWTEAQHVALGVLEHATKTLAGVGLAQDRQDLREWIDSESDTPGSFVWCCQACDLEPDYIRGGWAKMVQDISTGKRLASEVRMLSASSQHGQRRDRDGVGALGERRQVVHETRG